PLAAERTMPTVSTMMMMIADFVPPSPSTSPLESRENPAAIWRAPSPSETAEPNLVVMMARTSIGLPQPRFIRSLLITDWNGERIRLPRPIRKVEYASARPTTAYMPHGCSPQWKNVIAIASCAAPAESASAELNGGGEAVWNAGSYTP